MVPKQGLILCAGLGTRMKELSDFVPKAMLPFADGRLIDYQIAYLKGLGVEKILVNSHHHADLLSSYLEKNYPEVQVINEPVLLGSGGVFHNLKRLGYKGPILSVNADSFFFLDKNHFSSYEEKHHLLFGLRVQANENYNRLVVDSQNFFQSVVKNSVGAPDITFSGVSIIHLDLIKSVIEGPSSFFETVAIPGLTKVMRPTHPIEYWDFGTVEEYFTASRKFNSLPAGQAHLHQFVKKTTPPKGLLPAVLSTNGKGVTIALNNDTRAEISEKGLKILKSPL